MSEKHFHIDNGGHTFVVHGDGCLGVEISSYGTSAEFHLANPNPSKPSEWIRELALFLMDQASDLRDAEIGEEEKDN